MIGGDVTVMELEREEGIKCCLVCIYLGRLEAVEVHGKRFYIKKRKENSMKKVEMLRLDFFFFYGSKFSDRKLPNIFAMLSQSIL